MRFLLFLLILFSPIVVPVALALAVMDSAPVVQSRSSADADSAARATAVLGEFKALADGTGGRRELEMSQSDLDSVAVFATRALPFMRGSAQVTAEAVRLAWSADLSRLPGGGWINLQVAVPPSERGLDLASVRLGSLPLPADLVLPAIGFVLDTALGDEIGKAVIESIDGVAIRGDRVTVGVAISAADTKALAERARDRVREVARVSSPETVRAYWRALDEGVESGRLGSGGSVIPYLRLALDHVGTRAAGSDARGEMQAALLALAIYCGHSRFEALIGEVIPPERAGRSTGCMRTTLGGRGDLRQHFVVSAGLEAASDSSVAFAVGEFKELLDSNRGGSGFSFDDLAADRAGIRFARVLLEAGPAEWPDLIAALTAEQAILPQFADLPSGLSDAEFRRRYGDVDSAAYREMVAEIDGRIDRLAFFVGS